MVGKPPIRQCLVMRQRTRYLIHPWPIIGPMPSLWNLSDKCRQIACDFAEVGAPAFPVSSDSGAARSEAS